MLAGRPLWHDEIFTVWAARLDPAALVDALRRDSGPPLLYLLAKPLVAAAEAWRLSDRITRLLPWLAIGLLAGGARALPPGRSRVLFLLLIATSPLLLLYAAEARAYGILALVDLALFLLVTRARPTLSRLVACALLTSLALYLHYLAGFFVAALALVAAARRRGQALAGLLAGAALFLPWIPLLRAQPAGATSWIREPLGSSLAGLLSGLGGAGRVPGPFGPPLPLLLFAAGVGLAALAVAATAPIRSQLPAASDAAGVTLLFLAGIGLASVWRPVAFAGRSELAVLGVWLWGVAAASDRVRLARGAAIAMAITGVLASAFILLRAPRKASDAAPMLEAAARAARPEDLLVAGGSLYLPARLESDRGRIRARITSFPAEIEEHPGWFAAAPPAPGDYDRLARRLAMLPEGGRAFFLLHPLYVTPALSRLLGSRGSVTPLESAPDSLLFQWTPVRRPS